MKVPDEGLSLIKRFEGFRGLAYRCPSGVWTIGYGHTSQAGPPAVAPGMLMSEPTAEKILRSDVEAFAQGVTAELRRDIDDAQFSALVSFAYNVGLGACRSSSVLKAVNAGDFEAVPRRLGLWVKGGGKVLPGLVKRRAAEAALFMGGEGGSGLADTGVPEPLDGKPASRSTTVISGILAGLAAILSGGLGFGSGQGAVMLALGLVGLAAAAWIIRERLLKSKEEGV